ncbi:hypothetical protein HY68_36680 [Streptomyces sp. AcH 505]|uniref:hypothetical protein n=1 Tax=Streptomyces sp. AcH 505 TaxID=352211 RepID=UPI000592058E|nr:hypothetical protein HY68_36680 [Streptomyces sp. AcH 505]
MSSRTRTRKPHRTQPTRRAPAPQPPLRLVDLTKTTPISLDKPAPDPAEPVVILDPPVIFDARANAATATIHAGTLGIPAYYDTWTGMSTDQATALMDPDNPHSARLIYDRHPNQLTATQKCPHGQWHATPVTHIGDIDQFTATVADCTSHNPRAIRARQIGEGVHRATTSAADTQLTDVAELRAAHAADNDQPKEHPQP